ncbi:MAG: hypothetical protein QOJ97_1955 [Solirubrobacteraceae bacterium]|jgi:hypothetical protein|nr:hypothetical protein [Solirubrobacteraceae bacterium]
MSHRLPKESFNPEERSLPHGAIVEQALVAAGGRGSRFRRAGMSVPVAKSFLSVGQHHALHWCLISLWTAGVRQVILTAETERRLGMGWRTVRRLPVRFDRVDLLLNESPGTTGLPHHARRLLHDRFLFECGHSLTAPEHYRALAVASAQAGGVVMSVFPEHRTSSRRTVMHDGRAAAVGEPAVLDRAYVEALPRWGFDPRVALKELVELARVAFVPNLDIMEADTPAEFRIAVQQSQALRSRLAQVRPSGNQLTATFAPRAAGLHFPMPNRSDGGVRSKDLLEAA